MKIQKNLVLIILITIVSCNKTIQKDESISLDNKSTAKNHSKISLTIDNSKKCSYYFNDSEKLVKIEEYLRNGKLDRTINLKHKNNKFDYAFIGLDKDSRDDWFSNYYSNIEQYNDFLTNKNIKIDNPLMLSNEVSDIQNLLANIESFQKIKKEKLTIFQSKKINLKIRFDPSTITRFIPQNSVINHFRYALNDNGYLIEEVITFNDGILTIKYFYKKQKINRIIYSLRYNNGEILVSNQNYSS
ncbi:hypothetical protein [Flavobacterium sp. N502536]|uniref:hypothetical protein n=1 Tax=Flavobacterium sp. N502536 TaxID=2986837 RepID=UPI0022217736|nr:hypothetical protein [Flavobacterium sp. N502536]